MKNTQLKIKDLCPNEYIEIIEFYWELNEDPLEFKNTPKRVRTKYEIEQSELNKIIQPYSMLIFYLHCKNCDSLELNEVNSQYAFNQKIRKQKDPGFRCQNCIKLEKEEEQKRREIKKANLISKLDKAVDEKRWKNLGAFDYKLLDHCISKNFKELQQHYWPQLGKDNYKKLIKGLHNLAALDLLNLETGADNYRIHGYAISPRLKENFEYNPPSNEKPSKNKINYDETHQLKFKLTIDHFQNHPDGPKYAGVITFPKRIVIEPGVQYSFAQWERSGDDLYFVLTPTDEIHPAPRQTPISRLPTSLQEGIRSFMENIAPDSNDW